MVTLTSPFDDINQSVALYLVPRTLCDVLLYPSSPSSHPTHSLVKQGIKAVGVCPFPYSNFFMLATLAYVQYIIILSSFRQSHVMNIYHIILCIHCYVAVYFCMPLIKDYYYVCNCAN